MESITNIFKQPKDTGSQASDMVIFFSTIFSYHLIPLRRDSNPRQQSCIRLGPLKDALPTRLQHRGLISTTKYQGWSHVMRDGPGQTQSVVSGGSSAELVDEDEAVLGRRADDGRGLQHFCEKETFSLKPNLSILSRFCPGQPSYVFFKLSHHFTETQLFEGPDFGQSMIKSQR